MAAVSLGKDRRQNKKSIPLSPPSNLDDTTRDVFIVHRVMRGDGLVEQATDFIHEVERSDQEYDETMPHPLRRYLVVVKAINSNIKIDHWGVAVGDIIHHLQADSFFGTPNYYENKRLPEDEGYKKFQVGSTTFNDLAIQESGERTIWTMEPLYDPISNNCQHFTTKLVDIIVRSGRVQVQTTLENLAKNWDEFVPLEALKTEQVKRFGADLAGKAAPVTVQAAVVENPKAQEKLLASVQTIMDDNTPPVKKEGVQDAMNQVGQLQST
ncbi:MAG: hypothetical protein Q9219_005374 [cf. Caloplaca sp. 3 TL-2023]